MTINHTTPLLRTRLILPPPPATLVVRPDLVARVQQGLARRMTLISAPPGFGKTTLVVTALRASGRKVAWLAIDEGDNDLNRFLSYLIESLEHACPGVGQTALQMLHAPQSFPTDAVLTLLVNHLAAGPAIVFALDDYHLITNPSIHDVLLFLLEHSPPGFHILLLTRADPPFLLGRLRAQGQLAEFRAADLRFSREEATIFLTTHMGLSLSAQQVSVLERRTEGWIAGLHLAALSLQNHHDPAVFIHHFGGSYHHILDYLTEEVLRNQTEEDCRFLLNISILRRFCAALCAVVLDLDEATAQATLARLHRANLFLLPLDDAHTWFRYHHLFGDLLQTMLATQATQAEQNRLHARAAKWYADHDNMPEAMSEAMSEAVVHAFESGDMALAANIVGQAIPTAFSRGELTTVLGWLNRLPDALVLDNFYFSLIKAWILLFAKQLKQATPYLMAARQNLSDDLPLHARTQLAYLETQFALAQGDWQAAIIQAQAGLALAGDELPVMRAALLLLLAEAQELSGDLQSGLASYRAAAACAPKDQSLFAYIGAQSALAFTLNDVCRRHEALSVATQAWEVLLSRDLDDLPMKAFVLAALGILHYEANELTEAEHYLAQMPSLTKFLPPHQVIIIGLMTLARLYAVTERTALAELLWRETQDLVHDLDIAELAAALQAGEAIHLGRMAIAQTWATAFADKLEATTQLDPRYDSGYLAYTRYCLACGYIDEAMTWLARLADSAQAGGRLRVLITVRLLQAKAHVARQEISLAQQQVQTALALAAPNGYLRAFIDEGDFLCPFLHSPVRQGLHAAFAQAVINVLCTDTYSQAEPRHANAALSIPVQPVPIQSEPVQPASMIQSWPELPEALTPRELEVLSLIAQGLTNQEIAVRLVITVSTTKRHVANIYGKLGVRHRAEAVAHARLLHLID